MHLQLVTIRKAEKVSPLVRLPPMWMPLKIVRIPVIRGSSNEVDYLQGRQLCNGSREWNMPSVLLQLEAFNLRPATRKILNPVLEKMLHRIDVVIAGARNRNGELLIPSAPIRWDADSDPDHLVFQREARLLGCPLHE